MRFQVLLACKNHPPSVNFQGVCFSERATVLIFDPKTCLFLKSWHDSPNELWGESESGVFLVGAERKFARCFLEFELASLFQVFLCYFGLASSLVASFLEPPHLRFFYPKSCYLCLNCERVPTPSKGSFVCNFDLQLICLRFNFYRPAWSAYSF